MSNLDASTETRYPGPNDELVPALDLLVPREVFLGPHQVVRRVLPNRDRRMIGSWCFVDHYGPEDITGEAGMWIPPHPHTGLQTVSWLLAGEIRHRDSLGSDVVVRPGQLNLMTAGAGIAHSEESTSDHSPTLHGLQLWVALPSPARLEAPRDFTQYRDLPDVEAPGLTARVVVGELLGARSPALAYSPLLGAELVIDGGAQLEVDPAFEHGVLGIDGDVQVEGLPIGASELYYLGAGRDTLRLSGRGRGFLLGGEPFVEELVMWWNFIGRSHDEIVAFRESWNAGGEQQYGVVRDFDGERLLAPPMPAIALKPRGRRR